MSRILELGDLTAPEVDALDRARTAVFVSISPIEEHGPHLPLCTDVVESEGVARGLARRMAAERPGWTMLFHPPIPVGTDVFAYPGSLSVRPRVLKALVRDLGLSLVRSGFRTIFLANHHGGPRHNFALDEAARSVSRKKGVRMVALGGRLMLDFYFRGGFREFHRRVGDDAATTEKLALDCHAGSSETSEMLALRPDLVRSGWESLPPVLIPIQKLRLDSSLREGAGLGYFGAPALSSRARGETYLEFVVERLLPDALRVLDGERLDERIPFKIRMALWALRVSLALGMG